MATGKKGFLLGEETVKLILAVIAILFLILFIVFLYNNFSKNKELEQAKASLDYLVTQIDSGAAQAEIYNPKLWGVVSFLSSQKEDLPEFCKNKEWNNCICICTFPSGSIHKFVTSCNTLGVCQESEFSVKGNAQFIIKYEQDGIEITPPLILSINQENKTIQEAVESGA